MGTKAIKKTFLLIAVIGVTIFNTCIPVIATPNGEVTEGNDKYEEVTKNIDEIQGKIYSLNTEIEKFIEVIKKNDEELKVVSSEVEEFKKEIEKAKSELLEQEKVLEKRLRELYKTGGQSNYVLMLLTSDGITDFLEKFYAASKMVDLDKKVINDLKENEEKLNGSIKELEKKINNINRAKEDNKRALEELENKKLEQELLVTQRLAEQGKFDEEYSAKIERKLVEPQLKILSESNSLEELHGVIGQLINIRDKQLKSSIVIQEVSKSITEVTKRVEGLEKYLEDNGISISQLTSSKELIVSYAYEQLGKPYVFGSTGPNEFDCSGFTSYVYKNTVGIDITRTTYTQIEQGKSVPLSELQLGDLVFSYGTDHVGIYVGGGSYIHAPQPGESIKVSQITSFTDGRRIIEN